MPAIVKADLCNACGTCVEICPVECITLGDIAVVDADECIDCGLCEDECPEGAIKVE